MAIQRDYWITKFVKELISDDKGKNETVVEYSLAGYQNPIDVAEWKNQIAKVLPEKLRSNLPSVEEIEKELE